jgi:hypothetical protein
MRCLRSALSAFLLQAHTLRTVSHRILLLLSSSSMNSRSADTGEHIETQRADR